MKVRVDKNGVRVHVKSYDNTQWKMQLSFVKFEVKMNVFCEK